MSKPIVAISTSTFGRVSEAPLARLADAGFEVRLNPHGRKLSEDEARAHIDGVVGLVAGTETLTEAVMASAPGLKVVSRVGAGLDSVDLAGAKKLGIQVFNTPEAHIDAVAELALGGILASLRHIAPTDRLIRSGTWKKPMGGLLRGRTVGVIGMGRVGRAMVALLAPFGVDVLAFDPVQDADYAAKAGVTYTELPDLLGRSDVVTIHVPFSAAVKGLIGASELALLKPTSLLVNTARGGIVDEAALLAHLQTNESASAYLDCFEQEPYAGPLAKLENVLLTAHIGSYAREGRVRMESEAVDNLLSVLAS